MIHTPPPGMTVRRAILDRARWSRAIRGQITEITDIAVIRTLADYGNKDGSNCHPGNARLADDLCASESTVKRAMARLIEEGWVILRKRGNRRLGEANVYQLSIPVWRAIELGMCDPTAPIWMERPSGSGVNGDPKSAGSGVTEGQIRGQLTPDQGSNGARLGVTHDPPPGSNHQGEIHQGNNHHAALRALAPR